MSIFFGAFLMAATACSGAASPNRSPVFLCKIDGMKSKAGKLDKDSICNQFRYEIDKALYIKSQSSEVKEVTSIAGTDWVLADIKIENTRMMSATVSRSEKGEMQKWPTVFVSVSDSDIDADTFQFLAKSIGKSIASEGKAVTKN
jgi:hypothetical protein